MKHKVYLGDSVYVEIQEGQIILTTENGREDDPSNKIYLEVETDDKTFYEALVKYVGILLSMSPKGQ